VESLPLQPEQIGDLLQAPSELRSSTTFGNPLLRHMDLLHDSSDVVRSQVAATLVSNPELVLAAAPEIARALVTEKNSEIVLRLLSGIRGIRDFAGGNALISAVAYLLTDRRDGVGAAAIDTIGHFGPSAGMLAPVLYSMLRFGEFPELNLRLAQALETISPSALRDLGRFIHGLDARSSQQKVDAVNALRRVAQPEESTLAKLLRSFHLEKDLDVMRAAIGAIARHAPNLDPGLRGVVVPSLMLCLKLNSRFQPYREMQQTAAIALSHLGHEGEVAIPLLLEMAHNGRRALRPYACLAVGRLRADLRPEILPILEKLARDSNPQSRETSVMVAGRLLGADSDFCRDELFNLVVRGSEDSSHEVRQQACRSLGSSRVQPLKSLGALAQLYFSEVEPAVRLTAVRAISQLGQYLEQSDLPAAQNLLFAAMKDAEPIVGREAAGAYLSLRSRLLYWC
jgi:hypothetical protein